MAVEEDDARDIEIARRSSKVHMEDEERKLQQE